MGYKTTTDPFVLRASTAAVVSPTDTSGANYATIDTSLDTLNREVLLIWEVDIQVDGLPNNLFGSLVVADPANSMSIDHSVVTQQDFFDLSDHEYVAGASETINSRATATGNVYNHQMSRNPDSREMVSRDKVPLAIITASEIFCRTGFSINTALGQASDGIVGANFRIHAQRAKADADTYAALVTGLL